MICRWIIQFLTTWCERINIILSSPTGLRCCARSILKFQIQVSCEQYERICFTGVAFIPRQRYIHAVYRPQTLSFPFPLAPIVCWEFYGTSIFSSNCYNLLKGWGGEMISEGTKQQQYLNSAPEHTWWTSPLDPNQSAFLVDELWMGQDATTVFASYAEAVAGRVAQ